MSVLSGTLSASFLLPQNTFPIIPCEGATSRDKPVLLTVASEKRTIGTVSCWQQSAANVAGVPTSSNLKQRQHEKENIIEHDVLTAAGNLSRKVEHIFVAERSNSNSSQNNNSSTSSGSSNFFSSSNNNSDNNNNNNNNNKPSSPVIIAISRRNRGFWAAVSVSWHRGQFSCVDLSEGFDKTLRQACGVPLPSFFGKEQKFFSIEGASVCQTGERISFIVRNVMSATQTALVVGSLGAASWSMMSLTDPIIPPGCRIITSWTASNTCTIAFARIHPVVSGNASNTNNASSTTSNSIARKSLESWFREGVDRRLAAASSSTHHHSSSSGTSSGGATGNSIERLEQLANELPVCIVLQFLAVNVSRISLRLTLSNRGTIRSQAFAVRTSVNEMSNTQPLVRFYKGGVRLAAVVDKICHVVDIPTSVWQDGGHASSVVSAPAPLSHSSHTFMMANTTSNTNTNSNNPNPKIKIDFVGTIDPVGFFSASEDFSDYATVISSSSGDVVGIAARDMISINQGPAKFAVICSNWLVVQTGTHCGAIEVGDLNKYSTTSAGTAGTSSSSSPSRIISGSLPKALSKGTTSTEMREPHQIQFVLSSTSSKQSHQRHHHHHQHKNVNQNEEEEEASNVGPEYRKLDMAVGKSLEEIQQMSFTFEQQQSLFAAAGGVGGSTQQQQVEENSVFAVFERIAAANTAPVRLARIKSVAASCISSTQASGGTKWIMHVASGHEATIRTLGMICFGAACGVPVYLSGFPPSSSTTSSSRTSSLSGIRASLWSAPSNATLVIPACAIVRGDKQMGEFAVDLLSCAGDLPLAMLSCAFFARSSVTASMIELCCGNYPLVAHLVHGAENLMSHIIEEFNFGGISNNENNKNNNTDRSSSSCYSLAAWSFASKFASCTTVAELFDVMSTSPDPLNEADAGILILVFLAVNSPEWFAALRSGRISSQNQQQQEQNINHRFAILASPIIALSLWVHATRVYLFGSEAIGAAADFLRTHRDVVQPLFPFWQQVAVDYANIVSIENMTHLTDESRSALIEHNKKMFSSASSSPSKKKTHQQQAHQQQQQHNVPVREQSLIDFVAFISLRLISLAMRGFFILEDLCHDVEQIRRGGSLKHLSSSTLAAASQSHSSSSTTTTKQPLDKMVDDFLSIRELFDDILPTSSSRNNNTSDNSNNNNNSGTNPISIAIELDLLNILAAVGDPNTVSNPTSTLFWKVASVSNIPIPSQQQKKNSSNYTIHPGAKKCFYELCRRAGVPFDLIEQAAVQNARSKESKSSHLPRSSDSRIIPVQLRSSSSSPNSSPSYVSHDKLVEVMFPQNFATCFTDLEFSESFWIELRKFILCDDVPASITDPTDAPPMLFSVLTETLSIERRVDIHSAVPEAEVLLAAASQKEREKIKSKEQEKERKRLTFEFDPTTEKQQQQQQQQENISPRRRQQQQQQESTSSGGVSPIRSPRESRRMSPERPVGLIPKEEIQQQQQPQITLEDVAADVPAPITASNYDVEDVAWWENADEQQKQKQSKIQQNEPIKQQQLQLDGEEGKHPFLAAVDEAFSIGQEEEPHQQQQRIPQQQQQQQLVQQQNQPIENGDIALQTLLATIPSAPLPRSGGISDSPVRGRRKQEQQVEPEEEEEQQPDNNINNTMSKEELEKQRQLKKKLKELPTKLLTLAPGGSGSSAATTKPLSTSNVGVPLISVPGTTTRTATSSGSRPLSPPRASISGFGGGTSTMLAPPPPAAPSSSQQRLFSAPPSNLPTTTTTATMSSNVRNATPIKLLSLSNTAPTSILPGSGSSMKHHHHQQHPQPLTTTSTTTSPKRRVTGSPTKIMSPVAESAPTQQQPTSTPVNDDVPPPPPPPPPPQEQPTNAENTNITGSSSNINKPMEEDVSPAQKRQQQEQQQELLPTTATANNLEQQHPPMSASEKVGFNYHVNELLAKYGTRPSSADKTASSLKVKDSDNNNRDVTLNDVEHVVARQNALLEQSLTRHIDANAPATANASGLVSSRPTSPSSVRKLGSPSKVPRPQSDDNASVVQQMAQSTLSWREAALGATMDAAHAQSRADSAIAELRGMVAAKQADLDKAQIDAMSKRVAEASTFEAVSAALAGSTQHRINAEEAIQGAKTSAAESSIVNATNALTESDAVLKSIAALSTGVPPPPPSSLNTNPTAHSVAATEFASASNPSQLGLHQYQQQQPSSSTQQRHQLHPSSITSPIPVETNAEVLHHHKSAARRPNQTASSSSSPNFQHHNKSVPRTTTPLYSSSSAARNRSPSAGGINISKTTTTPVPLSPRSMKTATQRLQSLGESIAEASSSNANINRSSSSLQGSNRSGSRHNSLSRTPSGGVGTPVLNDATRQRINSLGSSIQQARSASKQ